MNKHKFATPNPWAICTASVGRDSADYEKCVMDVKKQYGLSDDITEDSFKNNLPVYQLSVQECGDGSCPTETNAIALVTDPAIEVDFIAFSKEGKATKKPFNFKVQDAAKRQLVGPLMIADLPIFRRDPNTNEEYYVTFDAQSIENCVKNFAKRGYNNNINTQHDDTAKVQGAYLMQNWIVTDPKNDKSAAYGFKDITAGSWFGVVYVANEAYWDEYIKTGILRGFSVEGTYAQSTTPVGKFNSNLTKEEEEMIDKLARLIEGL